MREVPHETVDTRLLPGDPQYNYNCCGQHVSGGIFPSLSRAEGTTAAWDESVGADVATTRRLTIIPNVPSPADVSTILAGEIQCTTRDQPKTCVHITRSRSNTAGAVAVVCSSSHFFQSDCCGRDIFRPAAEGWEEWVGDGEEWARGGESHSGVDLCSHFC